MTERDYIKRLYGIIALLIVLLMTPIEEVCAGVADNLIDVLIGNTDISSVADGTVTGAVVELDSNLKDMLDKQTQEIFSGNIDKLAGLEYCGGYGVAPQSVNPNVTGNLPWPDSDNWFNIYLPTEFGGNVQIAVQSITGKMKVRTYSKTAGAWYGWTEDKQDEILGAATTITKNNLTSDRALISNTSGKVAVSAVTSTELGYLDNVTSNVQTQLNSKQKTIQIKSTTVTASCAANAYTEVAITAPVVSGYTFYPVSVQTNSTYNISALAFGPGTIRAYNNTSTARSVKFVIYWIGV